MSYTRMSRESDVYVYADEEGLVCFGCTLQPNVMNFVVNRRTTMMSHLHEHMAHGHRVPEKALLRLSAEVAEFGDLVEVDLDH